MTLRRSGFLVLTLVIPALLVSPVALAQDPAAAGAAAAAAAAGAPPPPPAGVSDPNNPQPSTPPAGQTPPPNPEDQSTMAPPPPPSSDTPAPPPTPVPSTQPPPTTAAPPAPTAPPTAQRTAPPAVLAPKTPQAAPSPPPGQPARPATAVEMPDANKTAPIAEVTFLEPYVFDLREGRRNPFQPPSNAEGAAVNIALPGSPLERYELDEIRLVGIMWDIRTPKAMFIDPQGEMHVLGRDDRIGRKHGYIAAIREGEVVVVETNNFNGENAYATRILRLERDHK